MLEKKQQLEPDMEQWTGSKMRKDYVNAVYCQPPYLIYMQSTSCEMLGWMNQEGITIAGRNISNLRHADDTTVMAESKEELKSLLMRVKEESERASLGLNIKTKIMAPSPITAWQIEGEKVEVVTDFLFLGSRITADGDCSHGIRRRLLLGRKVKTNLDSVEKQRHHSADKGAAVAFTVVTYAFKSWTVKKQNAKELTPSNCGAGEDS